VRSFFGLVRGGREMEISTSSTWPVKAEQLELFPRVEGRTSAIPLEGSAYPPRVREECSLALALHWFKRWMEGEGYSRATCQTYLTALRIFGHYVGRTTPIGEIAPAQLSNFISWQRESGIAAKTVEIRGTAVRTFFSALCEEGILKENPAANVYAPKASLPPPGMLYQSEAEALVEVAQQKAEEDATELLLLMLMMDMGLRLGEVLALRPSHVDTSREPYVIHVRYADDRHRYKRRALKAPEQFPEVYQAYLRQHPPSPDEGLVHLSPRGIQYALQALGEEAGLARTITPSTPRWTYALRGLRAGVADDLLRRRLGLAPIAWREAKERLRSLVVAV